MNQNIFQEFPVAPSLQKHISQFFTIEVLQHQVGTVGPNHILPDCTTGMLFIEEGALQRVSATGTEERLSGFHIFGQKTSSVHYNFNLEPVSCFGMKLAPLTFRRAFDFDQSLLTNRVLNLEQILPSFPGAPLMAQPSIQTKVNFLENYFKEKLQKEVNTKMPIAENILDFIHQNENIPSVIQLSQNFNLSYKYLERLFADYIGISPKMYLRLTRFNRVIAAYHTRKDVTIHHLALDFGYFDQMHLIRDMKLFTGLTPSKFFARATRDLELQHRNFLGAHFNDV